MKKLTLCLMTALFMLSFVPATVTAATKGPEKVTIAAESAAETAEAKALVSRLEEIKAMDMSAVTSVEKRQLRKELRSIKARLNEMDGSVVYISAGALILIILLVILLL